MIFTSMGLDALGSRLLKVLLFVVFVFATFSQALPTGQSNDIISQPLAARASSASAEAISQGAIAAFSIGGTVGFIILVCVVVYAVHVCTKDDENKQTQTNSTQGVGPGA
ncbi:hypothetical protein B0H63DRAFT_449596 [Podospora didyma]|uniref:Uncharacterized protein n=1 Tax=Podospora didyma TaxID=330526 RepID=A0AAE0NQ13_9PEZI|nr:hypothetical protein B0H63DRAFT_449596 [Podospora didyma]